MKQNKDGHNLTQGKLTFPIALLGATRQTALVLPFRLKDVRQKSSTAQKSSSTLMAGFLLDYMFGFSTHSVIEIEPLIPN